MNNIQSLLSSPEVPDKTIKISPAAIEVINHYQIPAELIEDLAKYMLRHANYYQPLEYVQHLANNGPHVISVNKTWQEFMVCFKHFLNPMVRDADGQCVSNSQNLCFDLQLFLLPDLHAAGINQLVPVVKWFGAHAVCMLIEIDQESGQDIIDLDSLRQPLVIDPNFQSIKVYKEMGDNQYVCSGIMNQELSPTYRMPIAPLESALKDIFIERDLSLFRHTTPLVMKGHFYIGVNRWETVLQLGFAIYQNRFIPILFAGKYNLMMIDGKLYGDPFLISQFPEEIKEFEDILLTAAKMQFAYNPDLEVEHDWPHYSLLDKADLPMANFYIKSVDDNSDLINEISARINEREKSFYQERES